MKSSNIRLFLIFYCLTLSVYGQKKYVFDYKIEYTSNEVKKKKKFRDSWMLINSKDNSYQLRVSKAEDKFYLLDIIDLKGLSVTLKIEKDQFKNFDSYSVSCNSVNKFDAKSHFDPDEWEFLMKPDSLLNNQEYFVYELRHQKGKGGRFKNNYLRYFVSKKDSIGAKPVFDHFEGYALHKKYDIPQGVYSKKMIGKGDKIAIQWSITKLEPIKKAFVIPESCDFTKTD